MRIISTDEIDACLEDREVLETLRRGYRSTTIAPFLPDQPIARLRDQTGHLSLQPAWTDFPAQNDVTRGYVGCGLSLSLPESEEFRSNLYLLFSGTGGQPIAILDGMRLAVWRMAGLHALAAAYLSREDTSRLLVIGDNPRLPRMLSAFARVRNLTSVLCLGTSAEVRRKIALQPALANVSLGETSELDAAQDGADMICIAGPDWQSGAYEALRFLDPPAGCHIDVADPDADLTGELLDDARLFTSDLAAPPLPDLEFAADLADLAKGSKAGRRYYGQRTLFMPGARTGLADHALAAHIFLRS